MRAKPREQDVSSVARVGWTDLWGVPSALPWWGARKNSEFQSQPFELQIGLLDFTKRGKAFIDVALARAAYFYLKFGLMVKKCTLKM